jgi:hypothetical protein
MTEKQRRTTAWISGGALALVFGAGAAWRDIGARVDAKLDSTRFVQDSIARAKDTDVVLKKLDDIAARLSAIYCDGKPVGCQ